MLAAIRQLLVLRQAYQGYRFRPDRIRSRFIQKQLAGGRAKPSGPGAAFCITLATMMLTTEVW